jgi:hypothetical protein
VGNRPTTAFLPWIHGDPVNILYIVYTSNIVNYWSPVMSGESKIASLAKVALRAKRRKTGNLILEEVEERK